MTQKISEIKKKIVDHNHNNKHMTTKKLHKLTAEKFTSRLKQVNLATKVDIDYFIEKTDFDGKLKSLNENLLQIKQNTYRLKRNSLM